MNLFAGLRGQISVLLYNEQQKLHAVLLELAVRQWVRGTHTKGGYPSIVGNHFMVHFPKKTCHIMEVWWPQPAQQSTVLSCSLRSNSVLSNLASSAIELGFPSHIDSFFTNVTDVRGPSKTNIFFLQIFSDLRWNLFVLFKVAELLWISPTQEIFLLQT